MVANIEMSKTLDYKLHKRGVKTNDKRTDLGNDKSR